MALPSPRNGRALLALWRRHPANGCVRPHHLLLRETPAFVAETCKICRSFAGVMRAHDRLLDLERQVAEVMRGNVLVAARADGAAVVTADATPAGRAMRIVLSELRKEVPYDSCSVQELRGSRLVIAGGVGFAHLDVILG